MARLVHLWRRGAPCPTPDGFLTATRDGTTFYAVTRTGFDNPYNSGIRTMVSTPHGLAVGTVNPFGPEVAEKHGDRWEYVGNERGGLEVWLGSRAYQHGVAEDTREDEVLAPVSGPAGDQRTGPILCSTPDVGDDELEWSPQELKRAARRIDVQSVRPDYDCSRTSSITSPPRGRSISRLAHLLFGTMGRPARFLADHRFYGTRAAARMCGEAAGLLGFVQDTVGNGVSPPGMGEAVVMHPQREYSRPDYRPRPFSADPARIALVSGAPIVPVALIGPHESRQRVERDGQVLFLNQTPLPADYTFIFLPPLDARQAIGDPEDGEAVTRFCEEVRSRIEAILEQEGARRPLYGQARALQQTYGTAA